MGKVVLRKNGTVSIDGVEKSGFWDRRYDGRVDRGVKLGGWVGCISGGRDSPVFPKRKDLTKWLLQEWVLRGKSDG